MSDMIPSRLLATPFTLAQGKAHGLSRYEVETGPYRRIAHNAYIAAHIPDTLVVRCRALLLSAPNATFSHHTAAELWGGAVPESGRLHVAFNSDVRLRAPELRVHRFKPELDRARRHGLPVTTPGQTFVHLARHLDLIDLVAFGDRLCKRDAGLMTPAQLLAYSEGWNGQCRAQAMEAARWVRARTDSVPETKLRLLMVWGGLQEPVINHPVEVAGKQYFLDLAYPELQVAFEYDGHWHAQRKQRAKDRLRRKALEEAGWTIVIIRAEDLFQHPGVTLARVAATFEAAAGWCPRVSDRWRAHFSVPVINAVAS